MIIDIHTHAWPEKVSLKAKEQLESFFKVKFVGNPTVDTLLKFMDRNKVDISVICAVATRPEQVPSINNWLFAIRSKRIRIFAALHPDYPKWKEELKRIKDNADGIKFQPEFQNFYVDEKRLDPLYKEIERLKLPVIFHCGEELSGTLLIRSSPKRLIKIKERFPEMIIIGAHFGGFRLWNEVEKYLLGRDIYLDTSYLFGFLPKKRIKEFILKHRPDRLLFGTDFPLVNQKKDLDSLKSLKLPLALNQAILYKNAQRLLKII